MVDKLTDIWYNIYVVKFFGKCIFSKWLSRATSIIVDNLLEMLYNIRVVKKQTKEI
jgi:hypothetical protein